MDKMPTTRALFGYDVIGSSKTDDDQLEEVRQTAYELVEEAFEHTGVDVDGKANYSGTGDGSLAAYPEHSLPALIDAAHFLHGRLYLHNRRFLPSIRLRLAVHTGPIRIVEGDSFQRRMIELARLLEAAPLKEIVHKVGAERPVTAVLVVSDQAHKVAVRGGHTQRLHSHDFGKFEFANKEFKETCWVWIPGASPGSFGPSSDAAPGKEPVPPAPAPAAGSQTINGGVTGTGIVTTQSGPVVTNIVGGHRP